MKTNFKMYEAEIAKRQLQAEEEGKEIPEEFSREQDIFSILKNPELWGVINNEFDKKIEGEHEARKAIFFTFMMRRVKNRNKSTDNLMVNDEGGTGKDYIVSAIFEILPEDEKDKRVRITPKVLAYLNDVKNNPSGWIGKCLYLEDVPNNVLNDDAFKVMSSASPIGITQTSVIVNNKLININIMGKPSIVITIATASPKQELLRRYPIVNLTGSVEQTKAVLKKQAEFAMTGQSSDYDSTIKDALSRIPIIKVRVPFADKIAKIFPFGNVIIRTHFPRFLDYIKASCALHQYNREEDIDGYYIAIEQDYEIARDIMAVTTSNQLMIPLTKKQKQILEKFGEMERREFTIDELKIDMQQIYGETYLRKQLEKLSELGFLLKGQIETETKPKLCYKLLEVSKLELPSYEELQNCDNSKTSENSEEGVNSE